MRRSLGFFGMWLVATALAVGVSWFGVRPVLGAAGTPQPDLLQRVSPPSGSVAATQVVTTSEVTTTTAEPRTTTAPPTSAAPTTTTARTTTPKPTGPAPPESGTWVSEGDEYFYLRSIRLRGGVCAVRFGSHRVEAISATPNSGYSVRIERPQPTVLIITFQGDRRSSQLRASWSTSPSWKITESG